MIAGSWSTVNGAVHAPCRKVQWFLRPPPTFARMMDDEARDRLKKGLDQVHQWPSVYMFKFIFEPDKERLDAVLALFPPEAEVLRKYSAAGKYLSLTAKEVMMSAEEVLTRYDKAAQIGGVILL